MLKLNYDSLTFSFQQTRCTIVFQSLPFCKPDEMKARTRSLPTRLPGNMGHGQRLFLHNRATPPDIGLAGVKLATARLGLFVNAFSAGGDREIYMYTYVGDAVLVRIFLSMC